jgi:hypothetical protein
MKNFVFTIAFMLMSSLAFANLDEGVKNPNVSDVVTANFDNLIASDYVFSFNEKQLSHSELLLLADCTLKGKFTMIFTDGSKYSWEGTLTIVGQSCAQFLKEMMQK